MNEMKAEPFNCDYQLVKAMTTGYDEDFIVNGYYSCRRDPDNKEKYISYVKPKDEEVNRYAICRNSGLKEKNGNYAFEFDLVKILNCFGSGKERYGYLEWSEFYKKWRIKTSFEYSTSYDVDYVFEILGNVKLSNEDMQVIIEQDKVDSKRELIIDNSDCRPLHKRLKKKW